MNELMDELKQKVVETLGLADLRPEELDVEEPLFVGGLGLDSIDVLELVVMLERDYGVKVESKEAGQQAFASIRALAEFIAAQRSVAGQ